MCVCVCERKRAAMSAYTGMLLLEDGGLNPGHKSKLQVSVDTLEELKAKVREKLELKPDQPIELLVDGATIEDIRSLPLKAKVKVQEGQAVDAPLLPGKVTDPYLESQPLTQSPDGSPAPPASQLVANSTIREYVASRRQEGVHPEQVRYASLTPPHATTCVSMLRAHAHTEDVAVWVSGGIGCRCSLPCGLLAAPHVGHGAALAGNPGACAHAAEAHDGTRCASTICLQLLR
eukprot:COSAG02_NODE_1169_length_14132_cov_85.570187_7_plen_233_part_00